MLSSRGGGVLGFRLTSTVCLPTRANQEAKESGASIKHRPKGEHANDCPWGRALKIQKEDKAAKQQKSAPPGLVFLAKSKKG